MFSKSLNLTYSEITRLRKVQISLKSYNGGENS